MAIMKYKTRGNTSPQGKPRVYFCCHPEDFTKYFETIANEILERQNCAIWYIDGEVIRDDDFFEDLKQMQLFVMPVTTKLLCSPNEALSTEFRFAIEQHIPVLPVMLEKGVEEIFNQVCGDLQFLDKCNTDDTAISYEEKMQKYLESVLVGDELSKKIRDAFDAYVFLSYRKKDRRYAQELMRLIHKNEFFRDIAIWYDEFLTPGENFNDSIKEALQKSGLFVLTVTPNLVNEQNYIMTTEYPMAKQEGKPILPAELVPTDREDLTQKYKDIPDPADAHNEAELSDALLESFKKIAIKENDDSAEHNFYIGLAYLSGVDVEVDRDRAVELITRSANNRFPEAMVKLVSMYTDGVGVARDSDMAHKWSEKLASYYFDVVFTKKGTIRSKSKLTELFSNYKDKYWKEAIKYFLIKVDGQIPLSTIRHFYEFLMSIGICEYTLLFESCASMVQYQKETQIILVSDILHKSVDGTYPAYGPLFWYVPEFDLYEICLLALSELKSNCSFAKMLALVRDVCWIFGQKKTITDITRCVDGSKLCDCAIDELNGIRKALCELFYIGNTSFVGGEDVYPRCFNVAEVKSIAATGVGIGGIMETPFCDEFGLFLQTSYNELDGEYIGLIAAEYSVADLETVLKQKPCSKVRGMVLSPTEKRKMSYISFNRKHLMVLYTPENITSFDNDWDAGANLSLSVISQKRQTSQLYTFKQIQILNSSEILADMFIGNKSLQEVVVAEGVTQLKEGMFEGCTNLHNVYLPTTLLSIPSYAFINCKSLRSVVIPNGVTTIGERAFYGCSNLEMVDLPESITEIKRGAFLECSKLKDIKLPSNIVTIGAQAFEKCDHLVTVTLPPNLTSISTNLFRACANLREVKMSNKLKYVGHEAFAWCSNISAILLPDTIEQMGEGCFSYCTNLEIVTIPNKIKTISRCMFEHCENIMYIELGENIEAIEEYAFEGCKNLAKIKISNCLIKIEKFAFSGCKMLSSIQLPGTLELIKNGVFYGCSQLKELIFPEKLSLIEKDVCSGCTNLVRVVLPPRAECIGQQAFYNCCLLSEINFPDSLREIRTEAFGLCKNLNIVSISDATKVENGAFDNTIIEYRPTHAASYETEIIISENKTKIEKEEYLNRFEIQKVVIPEGVLEIGDRAFSGCSGITSVVIPASVRLIGEEAFSGCTGLESLTISTESVVMGWGIFYNCTNLSYVNLPEGMEITGDAMFAGCENLSNVDLPTTLKTIGSNTFCACKKLSSISLPEKLQTISFRAFASCERLTMISIPDSVINFDNSVFEDCTRLSCVTLPENMKEVNFRMFANCVNLVEIAIPNNVVSINERAFEGCKKLTTIHLPEGITTIGIEAFLDCYSLANISIPKSTTMIRKRAFENCRSLTTLTFPDALVGIDYRAFQNCSSLKSVVFREGLKGIGYDAFKDCKVLEKILLPSSLRRIGDSSFAGCSSVISITISKQFEDDTERIFGNVDPSIFTFI